MCRSMIISVFPTAEFTRRRSSTEPAPLRRELRRQRLAQCHRRLQTPANRAAAPIPAAETLSRTVYTEAAAFFLDAPQGCDEVSNHQ
jgi:hypothetical protein